MEGVSTCGLHLRIRMEERRMRVEGSEIDCDCVLGWLITKRSQCHAMPIWSVINLSHRGVVQLKEKIDPFCPVASHPSTSTRELVATAVTRGD